MKPVLNEATGEATDERLKNQKIVSLQIGLLQSGKLVYTTSANSKPVSSDEYPAVTNTASSPAEALRNPEVLNVVRHRRPAMVTVRRSGTKRWISLS